MKATAHKRGRDPRWPYVPTINHYAINQHGYRLPVWHERVGSPRATHAEASASAEEVLQRRAPARSEKLQALRERLAANELEHERLRERLAANELEHERLCAKERRLTSE
jgi:hypothetical protein